MKRILLLMWVLLLGISVQAQTTINVTSENTLASQLANLNTVQSTLIITGELTTEDFKLLNSNTYPQLASVTKLDLSGATVASISDMSGMNLSAMEFLRLPDGKTSADDVEAMANLHSSSKNAALKMAGAQSNTLTYDGVTTNNKEVAVYSFVPNSAAGFKTTFPILEGAKSVRMAGIYGDNDLIDHSNNNTPIFGWNKPVALWDFTGASFTECQLPTEYTYKYQTESGDKHHYDIDDPFKEDMDNASLSLPAGYDTNAFYYFKDLATCVVDIKLPTGIETLPPACLTDLSSENAANYKAVHGMGNEEFEAAFSYEENGQTKVPEFIPLETLVIPNNYVYLDHECAYAARITNLLIGNGVKEVRGGAFVHSTTLENLDFVAGISDCKIGNLAFGECKSMKHIALAEGIISLGANSFSNSQHLESIRLPETLIYIGNEAFNNCLALNSITIPSNVEKIGQQAFCLCPFTDIYLTTTDPDRIPLMWSAGLFTNFDGRASFNHGHFDGWEGFNDEVYKTVEGMTWDEAVEWYYVHVNGLPVLHYPEALADKVKAQISSTYRSKTAADEDGNKYGLPGDRNDMFKRSAENIESTYSGVDLLDENNKGKYTQDGWTQFVLMKAYKPGGESIVYTKEYSDVWYTMCFPFDLTDEQLAAAFNETFNIADFSGVQLVEKTETDPMKLVLHFDRVAVTYYKDVNEKVYYRLCEDGETIYRGLPGQNVWREQHGNFKYNVYVDPDDPSKKYHHVDANEKLAGNKTKTFALGNTLNEAAANKANAIIIDGILAEAGHPYMIHPAIGVNPGQPKKACNMSGITWKVSKEDGVSTEDYRDNLFTQKARTVDLGETSTEEENWDNYYQVGYKNFGEDHKNYTGQTYTFIGNAREIKKGVNATEKPVLTAVEPKEPKGAPTVVPEPTVVEKPSITLTDLDVQLYSLLTEGASQHNRGPWYGLSEITANWSDESDSQVSNYKSTFWIYGSTLTSISSDYATNNNANEAGFNYCKNLFNNYALVLAYEQYLEDKKVYDKYLKDKEYYDAWMADNGETLKAAYRAAVEQYEQDLSDWKDDMAAIGAFVVIPQYAYFLGTPAGAIYPKYFRQRSNNPNRSTGLWTQYSAIILPNAAALAGLETDLGGVTTSSGTGSTPGAKSHDIAFDEDYFFINDTPQGIATLIEKIEKEEGKADVKYMDIVVSIDGKIVSRDKTTFEGLPKGVYIINGKKYYVK